MSNDLPSQYCWSPGRVPSSECRLQRKLSRQIKATNGIRQRFQDGCGFADQIGQFGMSNVDPGMQPRRTITKQWLGGSPTHAFILLCQASSCAILHANQSPATEAPTSLRSERSCPLAPMAKRTGLLQSLAEQTRASQTEPASKSDLPAS